MANVVAFFGKNCTPNLMRKQIFFQTNLFVENTPFLKNLKKFIVIAPRITQI